MFVETDAGFTVDFPDADTVAVFHRKERIDYISNPKRQENLYATYATVDPKFWDYLAGQNRYDFKKSGSSGLCIKARELIIALPEDFSAINPNYLLKIFTEKIRMKYGIECISALHHNKTKTNYHTGETKGLHINVMTLFSSSPESQVSQRKCRYLPATAALFITSDTIDKSTNQHKQRLSC